MIMTKVTNTGTNPLVLSDGTFLPLGTEVDVKDWAKLKDHHVTSAMVESGQLSVGAVKEEQTDEKDELIAKLKSLGIDANGNSKPETLRKKLEEAEEKATADQKAVVIAELKGLNADFDEKGGLEDLQAALAKAKA
jgi:hypothetical protein